MKDPFTFHGLHILAHLAYGGWIQHVTQTIVQCGKRETRFVSLPQIQSPGCQAVVQSQKHLLNGLKIDRVSLFDAGLAHTFHPHP